MKSENCKRQVCTLNRVTHQLTNIINRCITIQDIFKILFLPYKRCFKNDSFHKSTTEAPLSHTSVNAIVEQRWLSLGDKNFSAQHFPDPAFGSKVWGPIVALECSRVVRRWHDKAEMKERSAPFRWHSNVAFLTMQPHISRILSLLSVENVSGKAGARRPATAAHLHRSAKQMTLETNERRRRRLSFVRAGTHGIQPCLRRRGRGIKKYRRRIFVSVSQTILLNGSRKAFQEGDTSLWILRCHPLTFVFLIFDGALVCCRWDVRFSERSVTFHWTNFWSSFLTVRNFSSNLFYVRFQ